jgi:type II secretory pathway pseudopilin PulG
VELLIAVVIIGVLTAIILPVYVSRAEEARLTAARADLESIATAQQQAAIDTGYFFRLFVLDDVTGGDGLAADDLVNDRIDGIADEILRGDALNMPQIFVDTKLGTVVTPALIVYNRLLVGDEMLAWKGPYINISRKVGQKYTIPNTPVSTPVDPWGSQYLFFTRVGVMQEPAGIIQLNWADSVSGGNYIANIFDRPTVLSLGPNKLPGDGISSAFGTDDDLIRQF